MGTLAKRIGTGASQPHAEAQTLEKRKEGKNEKRQFGKVDIPQEAFIAGLTVDS